MGTAFSATPKTTPDCLGPLVEEVLKLRDELRRQKRWAEADLLRECLQRANVMVEDTGGGARWRVGGQE
jgi:cysteinyl-tRNA synthetase